MRRVTRIGFLQKRFYPLFGLFPWECNTCREVKLLKKRGQRKRRGETTKGQIKESQG